MEDDAGDGFGAEVPCDEVLRIGWRGCSGRGGVFGSVQRGRQNPLAGDVRRGVEQGAEVRSWIKNMPYLEVRFVFELGRLEFAALVVDDAGGVAGNVIDGAAGVGCAIGQELFRENLDRAGEGRAWDRRYEDPGYEGANARVVGWVRCWFLGENAGCGQEAEECGGGGAKTCGKRHGSLHRNTIARKRAGVEGVDMEQRARKFPARRKLLDVAYFRTCSGQRGRGPRRGSCLPAIPQRQC